MILEVGQVVAVGDVATLSARVTWEQAERHPLDLFIDCAEPSALARRAEAFLPVCAIAAQAFGEERVTADAPVSPLFAEGLPVALAWSRHLSRSERDPIGLELEVDPAPPAARSPRHAMFFSGGVDSMAALRWNQQLAPTDHPHRISELVFVRGFEEQSSDLASHQVGRVAAEAGLDLVDVRTNLAVLDTADRRLWQEFLYGSFLASIAQALAGRYSRVTIAPSTGAIGPVKRVGSLPQLDVNFSSDFVQIGHPHFHTTRDERIAAIADWDVARRWLRPCSKRAGSRLNCGVCEKCVPTQVAIVAAGHDLREFIAFGGLDLEPDVVRSLRVFDAALVDDLVHHQRPRLAEVGRHDLVAAIDDLADGFMTWDAWRKAALDELTRAVPEGVGVQVIDLGQFSVPDQLGGRSVVFHWSVDGAGSEGCAALREQIEQQRSLGAGYLAILSSAFWWFDSYAWLEALLAEIGEEVLRTDRIRVVELA